MLERFHLNRVGYKDKHNFELNIFKFTFHLNRVGYKVHQLYNQHQVILRSI